MTTMTTLLTPERYSRYEDRSSSVSSAEVSPEVASELSTENDVRVNRGTTYGAKAVVKYAKSHECADMERFLNRHIRASILENQLGAAILDAGCGAGPWALFCGKYAKSVDAIDIQPEMIDIAKHTVRQSQLEKIVFPQVGDATNMVFSNKRFDHVLSINVGCNLPREVFSCHFQEVHRVLARGGTADIAVPDSLATLFTDGLQDEQEIRKEIDRTLEKIAADSPSAVIQENLNAIPGITSATFAVINGKLSLVTPEVSIISGTPIWRKLTKVTIPNIYYSEKDYVSNISSVGLRIRKIVRDTFQSIEELDDFNKKGLSPRLGKEYVGHSPFVIYQVYKP